MKLGFVLRETFRGLGRNITMGIALTITTAISLALLATGFLVTQVTEETKDIYLDRVEVMVQFDEQTSAGDTDCSSEACIEVREILETSDGIESVSFSSQEQSYERFVEVFGETDPQLVAETSPDALPAALHIRLEDPLDTTPLDPVRDLPQVTAVVDQADDLRGAVDNLDSLRWMTFLIAGFQVIAAVFLIANMVQIAAYNRREEMSIMRMVGASRWYIHAPFILEAVVATLLGAALAAVGLFLGNNLVLDNVLQNLYESRLIAPVTNTDIWQVVPIIGVLGAVLAVVTAEITLRFYVRK